jgi:hypothetical protein
MPGGDGTGPFGAGPKTGRAMGFCAGYNNAGFAYGRGRRFSIGRGFGGRSFAFWGNRTGDESFIQLQSRVSSLEKEIEKLRSALTSKEIP